MSSKHTPGPWYVDGMLVMDAQERTIAIVKHERDEKPIAAMPDMLAALEEVDHAFGLIPNLGDVDVALRDVVRAVIARARREDKS